MLPESARNPDALLEYIDARIAKEGMHYVMLDEVQWVDEFENVLNSYLKIPNVDVYVTGSNSKFLSSDVITEFRGRCDEIKVAPLYIGEVQNQERRGVGGTYQYSCIFNRRAYQSKQTGKHQR